MDKGGVTVVRGTRRPYINNQFPERTPLPDNSSGSMDQNAVRSMVVDSLKMLSRDLEEIKQSLSELEEKLEYLDSRQRKTENDIDKFNTKFRAYEADLVSLKSELEALPRKNTSPSHQSSVDMDKPMMTGTGFASVTPNYLRSLQQK